MGDQVTVEQLAHRLWEEEGQPEGKALEHWVRAEAMLMDQQETDAGTAKRGRVGIQAASDGHSAPGMAPSRKRTKKT